MWLSDIVRPLALSAAILLGAFALGGCSFSPVYSGDLASQPALQLSYAKPNSRLEQIVYQQLSLRLGSSQSAEAPSAVVAITSSVRDRVMSQTANPSKAMEVTVDATLTITPRTPGAAPTRYTRQAIANYTRSDQVLADRSAQDEAAERAAKAVAESLRLAVLAGLSR